MNDILKLPNDYRIICDDKITDARVRFELKEKQLDVYLKAENDRPKFVFLRWNYKTNEPVKVMGDKWERTYADMAWGSINPDNFMPWYFLVNNGSDTVGCGVKVRPNSFVSFEYDSSGVSAWFDVRCGAMGTHLDGRELLIGSIVCEKYSGISSFKAAEKFCKLMCDDPIFPDKPVYGGNNWYYAYGNSSYEEIISDASLQAELAQGLDNSPFMVIDDGWTPNACAGPWIPNEKYGDMSKVAKEFKEMGVRPGIWTRLLYDLEFMKENPECIINRKFVAKKVFCGLDPSHPKVKEYLRENIARIKSWGYELLKHDFSTADMFGDYGFALNGAIAKKEHWAFYDRKKTSAEIVLEFYKLIKEVCGDMIIIGCNTISHLCAGLVEINRIGDDTSGEEWERTRAYGVNTLAFRLPQNDAFYKIDADCVGILGHNIPWEMNKQWMDLLASSGSPLFISCPQGQLNDEQKEDVKKAYKINSVQNNEIEPLDWEYNVNPHLWNIDGKTVEFDWIKDNYPELLVDANRGNIDPPTKILCSDYDGTLNFNGIDDNKREAIERWRSKGNIFTLVSGRSVNDLMEIAKTHSFDCDYFIGHNGSIVVNSEGEIISSKYCNGKLAEPITKFLLETDCKYVCVGTDFPCKVFANASDCKEEGDYTLENIPVIPYFTQISANYDNSKKAKEVTYNLKEYFGDNLKYLPNGSWIDIVRVDANKTQGIYQIKDYLKWNYDDVIVVGNNSNDLDMIKEFKSYVMETGNGKIKKFANYITPSVTDLINKEI